MGKKPNSTRGDRLKPQQAVPLKPAEKASESEKRGWDGSLVIRQDIFGKKWASST